MATRETAVAAKEKSAKIAKQSKGIAQIFLEEVWKIVDLSRAAAFSGDWIWPLKGQYHLLTHPTLLNPLLPAITRATLFTLAVTALLFFFTYLPHVAVLAIFSGPLAFAAAVPIILGEGAAIGVFVSRIWWLGEATEGLFDEVLLREGLTKLVSQGRELQPTNSSQHGHPGKKLGKLLTKPLDRFSKENLIRWVVSLPLNAIPIVGPISYFLYNGVKSGPSHHARYFQLKARGAVNNIESEDVIVPPGSSVGIASAPVFDKEHWIERHRASYAAFGATSLALDLFIPGGAIICLLGNVVGAALWASQLEKEEAKKGL